MTCNRLIKKRLSKRCLNEKNHEWTRIHTIFLQSTEYTEQTEGLAEVGHVSEMVVVRR